MHYLHVTRLAEELRTLQAASSYAKWLVQLAKTDGIVLDARGLIGLDTRQALTEIIDDRAGNRVTLITSQLPIDHWHAWIVEPTMADAMLDRLLQRAHHIVLKSKSLRASPAEAVTSTD